jgi:hypothetical protein
MSISFARSGISDELTFYNRILDIWKYIFIKFQVNQSLGIYYLNWSKFLLLFS